MASNISDSGDSDRRALDQDATDQSKDPLSSILEATLAQGNRKLTPAEWALFRQIAGDAQQKQSSMQEFVSRLVQALLQIRMPDGLLAPHLLAKMGDKIAQTLCADPGSRERLRELQACLMEPEA